MFARLWAGLFRRRDSIDDAAIRRAFVDPLTQLPTRYAMLDRLREARKSGVTGVLAMCDVDMFKLINDRHGHQAGDTVLQVVANRLQSVLPPPCWVARLGGDEFVAFLPGMDIPQAQKVFSRCLAEVRRPFDASAVGVPGVTMSAGLVTFPGNSIDELLKAADVAMYAAKARGRDRVVIFDDDTREIVASRRELASVVVDLQERNRALRDEARTDALTGLRNRLALDEILDATVGGPDPRFASAAVAFIDIDHFGEYNHMHGDAAGDEALKSVATAVRNCSRDADLVFRKGGEELVVVISDASSGTVLVAAERLRAAVQALGILHSGSAVAPVLTVTVGVASGEHGVSLRQLLGAASEQAMQAKVANARNQVHGIEVGASRAPEPSRESQEVSPHRS